MSDNKSTPISSLNNKKDDSTVVNDILSKYNNLQENPEATLPPLNPSVPQMEKEFENRNMNDQLYNLNSDNTQFKDHSLNEQTRISQMNKPPQEEYYDEEDYDEYEIQEMPLWKKIVNEIRVPLFIFLMIIVFMSEFMNKTMIQKLPFLGNQFNEVNTKGFLVKAVLCSLVSYVLIRFIRV
jgi:hypothetical protein